MKLRRIACLSGLVALSAWSVAACSDDNPTTPGPDGSVDETGGSSGTGGKGTGGGATGGNAGKANTGGTAGKGAGGATGGSAGKASTGGSAGDGGPPITTDGGDPSITITDPKTGETISKDAEYTMFPKIPIAFTVANFVLKAPGSANCGVGCGHVHVNVDGNDCNVDANTPYNNAGASSPIVIDLSLCKAGVAGAHTIVASLHANTHEPVSLTDGGAAISSTITITAAVGDGGADGG